MLCLVVRVICIYVFLDGYINVQTNRLFYLNYVNTFLLRKYAFLRQVRFVSLQEKRYVSWRREE